MIKTVFSTNRKHSPILSTVKTIVPAKTSIPANTKFCSVILIGRKRIIQMMKNPHTLTPITSTSSCLFGVCPNSSSVVVGGWDVVCNTIFSAAQCLKHSLMSQPWYGLPVAAVPENVHTPVAQHAFAKMSPAPGSYPCLLYLCLNKAMKSSGLMMVWHRWVSAPLFLSVPELSETIHEEHKVVHGLIPLKPCYSYSVLCTCYSLHSSHLLHLEFCMINMHT